MQIELQGFGIFKIPKEKYDNFINILNLKSDLFLDLVNMQNKYNVIPILCINIDNIEKEGPLPFGYIHSEIGLKRFKELDNIINFYKE